LIIWWWLVVAAVRKILQEAVGLAVLEQALR
jgi:hypothetical protein